MVGGMSNVDSGSDPLTTDSNQSEKSAASNPDGKVGQKQIAQDAISHPKSQQIDRSPVSSKEAGIEAEVKKVETTKPSNRGSLLRKRNKNQPAFILPISNEKGKESTEKAKDEKKEKQRSPYSPSNLIFWTWDQVKWMLPILKNWSMMKPVIRSTILAWICLLMLLITPIEARLGQASFLVLIAAFIQPAELPLFAMLEREFFTLFLVLLAWAWSCIGLKIAYEVRNEKVQPSQLIVTDVFRARYTEAKPAVVCSIFLSFGCAAMLYLKIKFGPSPFLFGTILASLTMVISMTTGYLFPYPYYQIGEALVIPLALKAAINIVLSAIFYPKSVNSQFVEKLIAVLSPLSSACKDQIEMFDKSSPLEDDHQHLLVHSLVTKAEAALLPMSLASRLLNRELSFGLASGGDLRKLEAAARDVVPSADGWSYYQSMINSDLTSQHLPQTPAASRFNSPNATPSVSRAPTPPLPATPDETSNHPPEKAHAHFDLENEAEGRASESSNARNRFSHLLHRNHSPSPSPSLFRSHHSSNHSQHHTGFFHLPQFKSEAVPVGLWESLRAAGIENFLHTSDRNHYTEKFSRLLGESSKDILEENNKALDHAIGWLKKLNGERYKLFRNRFTNSREKNEELSKEAADSTREVIQRLEKAQELFWNEQRLKVIEPVKEGLSGEPIPSRYLFQVWVHQFHTQNFTRKVIALLGSIEEIQRNRVYASLYFPSFLKFFRIRTWQSSEESGDLEDPHEIEGAPELSQEQQDYELGKAQPRNPDALSPENWIEDFGARTSDFLHGLFKGNLLFFWKAAALTAIVSIPAYLSSSAEFFYEQKGVWVVFMALLTLARHRGETIFSLFGRLISTLSGACVGLIIWYIGTGGVGHNPFGLATISAALFPLIYIVRLYPPFPPIIAIIGAVTVGLVVGYSYKDSVNPTFGSPGSGWDVAWRRFVGVIIGCTAATIFSYLPPSSTGRYWQRVSHSTTIAELGRLHCDIIGFAGKAHLHAKEENQLVLKKRLAAVRAKLKRMNMATSALSYEFSFRGKWPSQRYAELFKIQMELSKLQSHLISVTSRLGPKYSKALLRRTRFLDPLFLGDCISVLSMCSTALRTGSPLPQITPCPLTDRFFLFEIGQAGLAITRDAEDDLGLPRVVDCKLLDDENYMFFAVGISSAFGLVLRIDRLCFAVKQLVGESFAVPSDIHRRSVRSNANHLPSQRY